jgi:hypothetical protein
MPSMSTGQEYGWIAISPNLTPAPNEAFAALSHLPRASELKPKQLDKGQEHFEQDRVCESLLTISAAARLGVAGIVDLSSSYHSTTLIHDHTLFSEVQDAKPEGGLILGTRWGAGLRIKVTVHEAQIDGAVNMAAIAAKASLGKIDASFEIQGLGFCDRAIFQHLPPPGKFDQNTLRLIDGCKKKISEDFLKTKKGLTPLPFMIRVVNPAFFDHPVNRARSFLHGLRGIAYENTLSVALERADRTIDPIAVRSTYELLAQEAADNGPLSKQGIEVARRWLDACGIPWKRADE